MEADFADLITIAQEAQDEQARLYARARRLAEVVPAEMRQIAHLMRSQRREAPLVLTISMDQLRDKIRKVESRGAEAVHRTARRFILRPGRWGWELSGTASGMHFVLLMPWDDGGKVVYAPTEGMVEGASVRGVYGDAFAGMPGQNALIIDLTAYIKRLEAIRAGLAALAVQHGLQDYLTQTR